MTIDDYVAQLVTIRLADGGFGNGEREGYERGVRDAILGFLVHERERHEDDIREINRDIAALKRRFPWLLTVAPKEHVEVG